MEQVIGWLVGIRHMKRGYLLIVAGGVLAAVAFILSLTLLADSSDGIFSPSRGLFDDMQSYFQLEGSASAIDRSEDIVVTLTASLEPVSALLLIGGGFLTFKLGRVACAWGLSGAVLNLTFQVWSLTLYYAMFISRGMGTAFGVLIQLSGSDYWLAFTGCLIGLIGVLVSWRERRAPGGPMVQPPGVPLDRRALRVRLAALLVLIGSLVAGVDLFFPPLQSFAPELSLLDAIKRPIDDLVLWPDLLAILLLLVGGAVALTGRKGAFLGSLAGALMGLTFRLVLLDANPILLFELHGSRATSYWLMVIGCALGLIGAALGLLVRRAVPTSVNMSSAGLAT